MSIAILSQVYDEARRLAIAGSVVARGDFRLKKLLPPLEQAGAKAPVFAKVAECAKAVLEGPDDKSAENLLELTSLVSAILYTQGETGAAGELKPIETVDLGGQAAQTSARLLKPLLEALSNTGSGRLELVKDAHERGAFRDLRLVKPALNGLDDPYPEIAEFLAEHVLPMYGKAILPELRAKYDAKGTKGHPRRLALMHAIDPMETRELVKQALEAGSKEMKVAAIACLGGAQEDLMFLVEQAGAKAQDVRSAAYQALAKIDDPAALAILEKAIAGKDVDIASRAIKEGGYDGLTAMVAVEIGNARDALLKSKDKKQTNAIASRMCRLIWALPPTENAAADALTRDLFARRAELAKAKGESVSGADVVEAVVVRMAHGPKKLQLELTKTHNELNADALAHAVQAARAALSPEELYDQFSPYVLAAVDKKKGKEAAEKRDAVIEMLGGESVYMYRYLGEKLPPLDPRWLDAAVKIEHLGLMHAAGRPNHAGANALLTKLLEAELKKSSNKIHEVLITMARLEHPGATDALLAAYEKFVLKAKGYTYDYWYHQVIPELPKSSIPKLEAFLPKLKDRAADSWIDAIQQLRDKK